MFLEQREQCGYFFNSSHTEHPDEYFLLFSLGVSYAKEHL